MAANIAVVDISTAMEEASDMMGMITPVDKKVSGCVHAVLSDDENLSATGRAFAKVAFASQLQPEGDTPTRLFHLHVYREKTLFEVGNKLCILNTSLNGRVLYCNSRSRVYK